MGLFDALQQRQRTPEWMDQPGLDAAAHQRALLGLRRVNAMSRTVAHLWPAIASCASGHGAGTVRVLDIACGGGDVALGIARRARARGMPIDVAGCDLSRTAVAFAQQQAREDGLEDDVRFFRTDVLGTALPEVYDVVTCSLFLHHLDRQQTLQLLHAMAGAARHAVVVSDLRRTRLGYLLAWIGCRLLTRSPIVHVDGPRSVAAAYTMAEMRELVQASPLRGARVHRAWPQRQVLVWRRSDRKRI